MRHVTIFFAILLIVFSEQNPLWGGSKTTDRDEIRVFAAISLTDALSDITYEFKKKTGQDVLLNFAGSDVLRSQIEKGFPADIYVSADERNVSLLVDQGWCDQEQSVTLLRNHLVVVGTKEQHGDWEWWKHQFIKNPQMLLAIGDPQFVPAGRYAQQLLEKEGLWPQTRDRIVPAMDVRAALSYVEQGVVDWALVYGSDARVCRRCRTRIQVQSPWQPNIVFTLAVARGSWKKDAVRLFLRHLLSSHAAVVFDRYGFDPDVAAWTEFLKKTSLASESSPKVFP